MAYTTRLVELTGIDGKVSKLLRLEFVDAIRRPILPTITPWKKYENATFKCPCGLRFVKMEDWTDVLCGKNVIGMKTHREQQKH